MKCHMIIHDDIYHLLLRPNKKMGLPNLRGPDLESPTLSDPKQTYFLLMAT